MNATYERKVLTAALAFAVLMLSSLAACGSAIGGDTKDTLAITRKDNGTTLKVKSGCIIYIGLTETGSTGYAWYFDKLDTDYFEALRDKSVSLFPDRQTGSQGKMAVGAPMLATWTLLAKKKGRSEIKLLNYRIWEGPKTAVDSFVVQIEIE